MTQEKQKANCDVAPLVDNTMDATPNGPMTRSRVKALHEKVTPLLSMCDLDRPSNGLLLHVGTLCVLRIHPDDDPQWSREDEQDGGEGDQEETPKVGQGEEEGGEDRQAGLQPGLGRPPGRHPTSACPATRPDAHQSPPASQPGPSTPPPASLPASLLA